MAISLGFFSEDRSQTFRNQKGSSLLELPHNYTLLDIETTGLDPRYDSIIELCAIRVRDLEPIASFSSLINPEYSIDEFIIELTGINNEMLAVAPTLETVLSEFLNFVDGEILLGHNINFDINFIYDACKDIYNTSFTNSFVDTMRLARRIFPRRKSNSLRILAEDFDIIPRNQHRAEADCLCTQSLYKYFLQHIEDNTLDTAALFRTKQHMPHSSNFTVSDSTSIDSNHRLYGKTCVLTGKLDRLTRAQAMQLIANIGGINGDNITKQTDYLILGNQDYNTSVKNGKSSKHKKAEALILKGYEIAIMPDDLFYELVLVE